MGEGIDKVKDGTAFGFFSIPFNFTANYIAKYALFRTVKYIPYMARRLIHVTSFNVYWKAE